MAEAVELGVDKVVPELDEGELAHVDASFAPFGSALAFPLAGAASHSGFQALVATKHPKDRLEMG